MNRHLRVLLVALAGVHGVMAAEKWPAWKKYQTILWSTGLPADPGLWADRVREAGYTAVPLEPNASPDRLPYYVENLVSELGFHHGRAALYEADWKGYTSSREVRFLIRKPCFDDPAFWQELEPRLLAQAERHKSNHPLLYDLRDEPSLGSFTSPMDYCFCPHTLRAFRQWLQGQYQSLAALNAEWGTSFSKWDDVTPLTTFEVKAREKAALAAGRPENFAPWADHRAYMDFSFAKAIDRMRAILRQKDPETPVGIAGVPMASAWGGFDLWRLSQVVDWMEPYDSANSRAILASFLPEGVPVLATYFGSDAAAIRRTAWSRLLDGDAGAIVWDDDKDRVIQKSSPQMPITQRGRELRDIFAEIQAAASKLSGQHRVRDRIAIHYSQASIRAHWMFDSREDGDTWPRRLASYELEHSRLVKVRNSFVKIVEDVGLTPEFIAYEQIEKGDLVRRGYKVLLLPQSVAMSAAECRQIEAFVRAGGTVIADNMVATMDEHGRRLAKGQLDEMFGVHQRPGWKLAGSGGPVGSGISAINGSAPLVAFESGVPVLSRNRIGKGTAVYLNLDMHAYGDLRASWPRGDHYRAVFEGILKAAGVEAPIKILGAHNVKVQRFAGKDVEYLALTPAAAVRAHVVLARLARVRELSRDFGRVRELDLELDPQRPAILELR